MVAKRKNNVIGLLPTKKEYLPSPEPRHHLQAGSLSTLLLHSHCTHHSKAWTLATKLTVPSYSAQKSKQELK